MLMKFKLVTRLRVVDRYSWDSLKFFLKFFFQSLESSPSSMSSSVCTESEDSSLFSSTDELISLCDPRDVLRRPEYFLCGLFPGPMLENEDFKLFFLMELRVFFRLKTKVSGLTTKLLYSMHP